MNRDPVDSPFLGEVSYEVVPRPHLEPRAEGLSAVSPFQTALDLSPTSVARGDAVSSPALEAQLAEEETGIIGDDNRVRITDTTRVPFRWICKIEVKDDRGRLQHGGTGVLVSDRHVLTAAHVIETAAQNMQRFSIEVKPALDYGTEPFGSYAVSTTPKLPRHYRRDAENALDWDYALLTLPAAVGRRTFSKLGGQALGHWGSPSGGANSVFARPDPSTLNGKAAFTAGYPRSAGAQKLLCAAGILVSVVSTRRTMRITADTTLGQSGSPVWIVQDGRCCLVGIAAGAGTHLNVVVRVTRELVRQVRAWIVEDGDTPSMIETEEPLDAPSIALTPIDREEDEAGELTQPALDDERPSDDEADGAERNAAGDEERPEDYATGDGDGSPSDFEWPHDAEASEPGGYVSEAEDPAAGGSDARDLEGADFEAGDPDAELEPVDLETTDDNESEQADEQELESPGGELDDEVDLQHLLEHDAAPSGATPTLGFEFDLNYGFERPVAAAKGLTPPAGWHWPSEGLRATDHAAKTAAGDWQDAIHVSMDAVRLEIASAPIRVHDDAEFERVVKAVQQFGKELADAPKTRDRRVTVPDFGGHPTTFTHPRTVVNKPERDAHGNLTFPGDSDHATYLKSPVPLVIHRLSGAYPTGRQLWASPQATLTLPLAEFGALIWQIHTTAGGAPGVAFTGRSGDRLGLRDDLAWLALTRAVADRKKRLGTRLSDGTTVTEADFTRSITSLVTILVMYMLTGVLKDSRDEARESFAKGSLPLNVKTPLWQIHRFALTDRERFVFKELYGAPDKRDRLYTLARPDGDGSYELFPEYTRWDPERFFATAPRWETLVEAVVDEKPMVVTKDNTVPKKKHRKGDEILIASLSSKIDWDKTKPLIAVEMRRLGFAPVYLAQWGGLMKRLRELARKVNP
jgi:V8-like Glu-specific endopeptidase